LKKEVTPQRILEISGGFMPAKALHTATKLGLFTELAKGPLDAETLRKRLGLHPRGATDFFDTLVSLGMLSRTGGTYHNAPEADRFLDKAKPTYIGGMMEYADEHLYPTWGRLGQALKTGKPQSGAEKSGNFFDAIYSDREKLRTFLGAMTGISMGPAKAIATKFPWSDYETFVDVGTAQGGLAVQICLAHKHLKGSGFDLPIIKPVFEEYVGSFGLAERLKFVPGDFFKDQLKKADVVVMGHILHDWNLEEKQTLIKKAYEALPKNGAFLVYESILDNKRRENGGGLISSLNMLVETSGGSESTHGEYSRMMRKAGFRKTSSEHLIGPKSMIVGIK
jgi:O-methyltransferase/methyltransferase family protein